MRTATRLSLALVLLLSTAAFAERRPHEGKITRVDPQDKVLQVQGEKGDTWDLFLTETTKLDDGLVFEELKVGDKVDFEFVEKEGKKFLTELERTKRAKR